MFQDSCTDKTAKFIMYNPLYVERAICHDRFNRTNRLRCRKTFRWTIWFDTAIVAILSARLHTDAVKFSRGQYA